MKPTYILFRTAYDDKGTPGEFRDENSKKLYSSLERPRNGNKKDDPKTKLNESGCIQEGTYLCVKYSSEKFPNTWEITGVKNKTNVLLHRGNCIDDSKSCIIIGERFSYNVKHPVTQIIYKYWLMSSKIAFSRFQKAMPKEFYLKITSQETEDLCQLPSN